jgi:hypothetical protein
MSLQAAGLVANLLEAYLLVGVGFAVVFLPRAAARVDPHLGGSPLAVRLLILPGVAALWPLMAWRWLRGAEPPVERNAHRRAAAARTSLDWSAR